MEDGSMKRFLTITLASVLIFCSGCSKQAETNAPDTSVIAQKYAPESSIAVLRFSSVEKLFSTFNIKPESVMGQEVSNDRSEMTQILGFDPMDLTQYDQKGFDIKKEFGFVLSSFQADSSGIDNSKADIGFLVPVKDKDKAYKYVKETLEKNKEEGMNVSEASGMISITSDQEPGFLATIKADKEYMAFNISMNTQQTAGIYFDCKKHLADTPNYAEVAKSLNLGTDASFYMDFKTFFNAENEKSLSSISINPMIPQNEMKALGLLKSYRGIGAACDLSKSDLIVNMAAFIDKDNPFNKLIENTKSDKSVILGFEKRPALLFAFMVNIKEYLNFYLDTATEEMKGEFESKTAEINQEWGIDIRKDFIDILAGSVNLGLYDGGSINLMQYNAVVNFNVTDPAAIISLIEKTKARTGITEIEASQFEQMFQIQGDGKVKVYQFYAGVPVFIAIENDNVSIISTKDYVTDILNKSNAKFIDKANKDIAPKLKNDQNFFFLDIAEAYLAAKNLYMFYAGMSGQDNILNAEADKFVSNFEYIYSGGNFKGEKAVSEFIVKTKFTKPFFIALQEEWDKVKASQTAEAEK